MGRSDVAGSYSLLDGDGRQGFVNATERLLALGHRRIVHLAAPSAFTFATLRREGFEAAMRAAGLPAVSVETPADAESAYQRAVSLLSAGDRPTAILCATDRMAYGVLRAARETGLSVPDDLSVVGHDNLPASASTDPGLSTMELPLGEAGERLAGLLLDAIKTPLREPHHDILPVKWIERGSTAPCMGSFSA
jgi:LacI family transcriptional regulator